MIEKEFTPYQESIELKKLGFDKPCFGFYERGKKLVIQECEITDFHSDSLQCVAPTFSQAFRWFREKFGYLSYIDMDTYSFYRYTIYKGRGISEAPYETYEEAELACLRKLFEIVKEK